MRKIPIILGFIIASHFAVGLDLPKAKDGNGFESVFQKLISGESKGTVNGLLILQNVNKEETIVDFQSRESKLIINADSSAIYDVSTKIYKGKTARGKAEIEYKTYAYANSFSIKLKQREKKIQILPNSVLVFAIKRLK